MRIISGIGKGRILKSPPVKDIRPTSDMVKEALFDILGTKIKETCFLELFAGSGGVGIESLSRGAKSVVFVERNARCIKTIRNNLDILSAQYLLDDKPKKQKKLSFLIGDSKAEANLLHIDVLEAIHLFYKKNQGFDIIFLDPPYSKGLVKKTLINIGQYDILNRNGIVIIEHSSKEILPQPGEIYGVKTFKERKYSDSVLSFCRRE